MALLLGGCQFYYEDKQPGDRDLSIEPGKVSYQLVREAVFRPKCTMCHGSAGGVNLESLENVKRHLAGIERTALVQKSMPKNSRLTPKEAKILRFWIDAGAPAEPEPSPSPIEPLRPNFRSIRANIMERRCLGCHSAGGAAERVPLGTLKDILESPREIVIPGNPTESGLTIALERTDSNRMPPPETGPPLALDEIRTIKRWIEIGAPETE